ncbi:hypothetical protein K3495_g13735 [Podosphaera aphanis]|nr:hypothetical protein K3495_g13735 [Podosphaera aphanis]
MDDLLRCSWSDLEDVSNQESINRAIFSLQTVLVPSTDCPIDELIDRAYKRNSLAQKMTACLKDPECRQWDKAVRKKINISFADYMIVDNKMSYKDVLFIPSDYELLILLRRGEQRVRIAVYEECERLTRRVDN